MDTKWRDKTLSQKVRYVCSIVLSVSALLLLIISEIEPLEYAFPLSIIFMSVGGMLRSWDFLKAGNKTGKLNFALNTIMLLLAILLLLRKLFR